MLSFAPSSTISTFNASTFTRALIAPDILILQTLVIYSETLPPKIILHVDGASTRYNEFVVDSSAVIPAIKFGIAGAGGDWCADAAYIGITWDVDWVHGEDGFRIVVCQRK
jgi:hypothetical protein